MTNPYFRFTYRDARDRFLGLCNTSLARIQTLKPAVTGPDGGAIYTDIATWGTENPQRTLILSSGTHGIEGYAGSGIQCSLLAEKLPQKLPANTQLVMIHAINPHGFAWQRRVNEKNIDLNRNFINHDEPHPGNAPYDEIADLLEPSEWRVETASDLTRKFQNLMVQKGRDWFQSALTSGQYGHPQGLFYGGQSAAWSNRMLRAFARLRLASDIAEHREIIFIDIHTALGKFGEGECIVEVDPQTPEFERAQALWGDRVKSTLSGDSTSAAVSGSMLSGIRGELDIPLIATGLEFGTTPSNEVIMALIADQWLHRHGILNSAQGRAIKAQMMAAFYPNSDAWRNSILNIARDVVQRALAA